MVGTTISHYRILESLGSGGMGEVFLAEDVRLHRRVALKILSSRQGCEDDERARLLGEARATSALNHPGIAVIYDIEEAEGPSGTIHLLAMEYVPGTRLDELVPSSPLSLDEILDVIGQAAEALDEAHSRGVVHGDIKPSNLMLSAGRVKILDFGLAQIQASLADSTQAQPPDSTLLLPAGGGMGGTPSYMSPEQALGRPLDARSDLFSLGIVFYELLAGRRPFAGDSLVAVADSILHRDPPPLPPRLSDPRMAEVERLLRRMLSKPPDERPSGLREVATELQRLRKVAVPGAAPPQGPPSIAVAGFANITGRAEDDWLGTGLSETITAALKEIEGLEVRGPERLRDARRELGIEGGDLLAQDAVELGRAMEARWVLAGGFQRSGDQVRVTVRVVEVESGSVLRAVRRDGGLEEIFALQDAIVAELTAGLRTSVAAAHEGGETQSVVAYEALSKGLLNMRALSYESLDRAILLFERALAIDPGYTRALVELGAAYAQKADYLAAPELHDRAVDLLRRATGRRPASPRAWRELGMALTARGRMAEAIECLERALSLAPDDPYILGGAGRVHFIGTADFARAAELFARAVRRNPQAGWYWMQLAHCRALLREFEPGEAAARRAIELQDASVSGQQGIQLVGAHMRFGHLLALQRRFAEASEAFDREIAFSEELDHALRSRIRIELHMRLGASRLGLGDRAKADAAFDTALEAFSRRLTLGADDPFTRYYAAAVHALRGAIPEALSLLERCVTEIGAFATARARIEPEWDGLRGESRFERLIGAPSVV